MSRAKNTGAPGPLVDAIAVAITTDKDVDLAALAAELGSGVILSTQGVPGPHPLTGHSEPCTIYVDPASPVKITRRQLQVAIAKHVISG